MQKKIAQLTNGFSPEKRQGAYFDGAVFLGNLLFVPLLMRFMQEQAAGASGETSNPRGGMLFLAAFVAQALGASLKRPGLQARIAQRDYFKGKNWTQFFGGSTVVLLILHYIVFCCAFTFGIANLLPPDFHVEAYENNPAYVPILIALMVVASVPTLLVMRALKPYPREEKGAPESGGDSEFIANILLYFSVEAMVSFWSGVLLKSVYEGPQQGGFHPVFSVLMTLLLALPFFMFYVIPRLLFLVEDSMYVGTWVRMFIAMLPVSFHLLKG